MSLISILLLILIGLILLIIEILFVPGMILGFFSVILMIIGIYFSFKDYGTTTGLAVLLATTVASILAVYWAFHSSLWKKLQVSESIDGKSNVLDEDAVKTGDTGKTLSRLNPAGKILINSRILEAHALEGFIDENKNIRVIKLVHNKIIVVPEE